ncbi:MAG: exosome complex protein Rrp42, partial [Candidatus Nanoarchaeia archaeon]
RTWSALFQQRPSPDEGTFMATAELGPLASEEFDLGPPKINAIELARVIDRGIRESGLVDMKKLCIKPGEKVWQVFVDIYAINDDGNLLDAAALAALIALGNARLPVYNEETGEIEHELTDKPLPLNKEALSFNMTFHKIGDAIVVDPSYEEEEVSEYRVSLAIGGDKEPMITSIQKGKEGAIEQEDMDKIIDLGVEKWKEMFPKIKEYVWGKK